MSQLPSDRDDYPNRVPQAEELASLRARASQRQKLIHQVTKNANAAAAAYESLKIRYEEQLQVLEKIQSELRVAKDLMDSLTELAASPDPELHQLQALLQPIRRYPDDHLRLIFQEYTEGSTWPFRAAVTLSHVCQHWRGVALSTPRLWNCVTFRGGDHEDSLKLQAEAFVARVGRVPTAITINITVDYMNTLEVTMCVKRIPFDIIFAVPVISTLRLSVSHEGRTSLIFDTIGHVSHGNVNQLTFHCGSSSTASNFPSVLASKFSGLRILNLEGCSFEIPISPRLNLLLTSITEINFKEVPHLPIAQMLSLMHSNLQKLTIKKCRLVPSEPYGGLCFMLSLQFLSADCDGFPWNRIQCPKLAYLLVPDSTDGLDGEHFWEFCSTTESITSVIINLDLGDLEQFTRLARSAPNLRKLQIEYPTNDDIVSILLRHHGLDRPAFPDLLHLIFGRVNGKLKADTLDGLIRRRCFPRDHPESMLEPGVANPLEVFEIMTEGGPADWKSSRYLSKYFVISQISGSHVLYYRFSGENSLH